MHHLTFLSQLYRTRFTHNVSEFKKCNFKITMTVYSLITYRQVQQITNKIVEREFVS